MLKHLENSIESDPKLQIAPVNYEGVSFDHVLLIRKNRKNKENKENSLTQINNLLFKAYLL